MRILDLYCGAGGASVGYHRAGFDVVGVDINPQPNYPFEFHQADAIHYLVNYGRGFDAVHASPPCQIHSKVTRLAGKYAKEHVNLIPQTRFWLECIGLPYIIENVEGAPLLNPITLCGSQFPERRVYRHRQFESNFLLQAPEHRPHDDNTPSAGRGLSRKGFISISGSGGICNAPAGFVYMEYAKKAMGIDWMNRKELSQSIPPDFTEYIGRQLMAYINDFR